MLNRGDKVRCVHGGGTAVLLEYAGPAYPLWKKWSEWSGFDLWHAVRPDGNRVIVNTRFWEPVKTTRPMRRRMRVFSKAYVRATV